MRIQAGVFELHRQIVGMGIGQQNASLTAGLERIKHMSEEEIAKHFKNLKFGVKPRWRLKDAAGDIH